MSRGVQKTVALSLTVTTGLIVVLTAGLLTGDALAARWRKPQDEARLDQLFEQGQADGTLGPILDEEIDRQTELSLARESRQSALAWVLLTAAAGFLLGAKWFVTLRRTRLPVPTDVLARHAAGRAEDRSLTVTARIADDAAPRSLPVLDSVDLAPVDEIVARHGRSRAAAIPILHVLQQHYRYLPDAALARVCELTEITPAQITGVASFYTQFRRTPVGEHVVTVCHGTACHVAGAPHITHELRRHLGLRPGEDTDAERQFTVQAVPCLGCCTLAPVVQIDGVAHGHTRPDAVIALLHETQTARRNGDRPRARRARARDGAAVGEIRLGLGSCCIANGSGRVQEAVRAALDAVGVDVDVKPVGCVGMCHQTPLVEIVPAGQPPVHYARVQPQHVEAIVRRHFRSRHLTRRLRNSLAVTVDLFRGSAGSQDSTNHSIELRDPPVAAFLGRQKHIATEHYGDLSPLDLDEYLARGGFDALRRCREELAPEEIIERIDRSGLRGRGGAGFPAGTKWGKVRQASGNIKYVICNGDEGDPGAFMDRMLMESYPYRVIEGLAIAARAVGAGEGVLYIRAEYPLAVERIEEALRRCEQRGLLDDLAPGRTRLNLGVAQGAGAFVCGEESALIAALEGQRGTPRMRPPYPAEEGLWGRPTLVSNVETYAVVPWILRNGPEAFAALGTQRSKGTKVFALTGKIARGGLIEVPMGITIREIVEDIGGGIKNGRQFKAVQIGGPSGGCVPAELADTPVDFEALAELGAIMGSGGLVVLDDTDCLVDIARYFLTFTQDQSCGKCAPCRIGTRRMLEILERLCLGEGRPDDLDTLAQLSRAVGASSLCGLGKTAPNPVLTTLRYFRGEYEAHLEGRCPAGKCPALITYRVTDACTGCTLCAQHCPAGAIALRPYEKHEIDVDKCTRCDVCRSWCPENAIEIE